MTWQEWIDVIVRALTILGLPSVVGWYLYDRRRLNNESKRGELAISEDEATLPNRVRSSSVVTLEAEIMALSNSFDTDRRIKENTIAWLQEQLDEARDKIEERDRLIDNLQMQLNSLREKVGILTKDLDRVQSELNAVRKDHH